MTNQAQINSVAVDGAPSAFNFIGVVVTVAGWYAGLSFSPFVVNIPFSFGCAGIACVPYERRTVRIGCGASSIIPC